MNALTTEERKYAEQILDEVIACLGNAEMLGRSSYELYVLAYNTNRPISREKLCAFLQEKLIADYEIVHEWIPACTLMVFTFKK